MPCTTILAGKKATADGSTLIARNEDFSTAFNPKRFVVVTPDTQPKNYQSVTSKCKVDLPANPLRYTALPQANIKTMGIWAEGGINAANVCMSATETSTTNPRVLGIDPMVKAGIGEEDFVTIILPYIHSAREGVQLLGSMLEKYGTYESNGVAFSDKDEVWYMETIGGHHWAAKRVPDDCYVAAPNWFSITDFDFNRDDTLASAGLEELIEQYHLNTDGGNTYNFRHIFGSHNDSDYGYNIPRQWYIQRLFNPSDLQSPDNPDLPFAKKPEHLLTIEDFKYALSSRYQHTPYDPYGRGSEGEKHAFRPIGFQRNQEVHVLQVRNDVPADFAAVCWLAYGPNAFNGLAPFYTNVMDTPAPYRDSKEKDFDINNMYWLTHAIATIVDEHPKRYSANIEALKQNTLATGRHILLETDQQAAKLSGKTLQDKLQAANDQTAKAAHDLAMKCLGDIVKVGALKIKLNY
ncbi:MAG: C69 family dipeptidase [[Lactobacillus] timonensis]|jgi:dipeptidase|uniref:C69 family dipeptidase n=1 Tax=[Lactobacillus] timonensis TaxID=1970790 RepID=UPI0023572758|nr:C69 family dipeptidase [[Lactobacillus] timonensis]MCI1926562.1 C69 family dipeptidase [[Lactobacillus] timonensis]MCI1957962.1 C69 family dipeptidase [[Lactobacillus] timonensis]MCI1970960.1 C69 family dipeptidase [[Lactobacillus] timonensis]MCI2007093.1 C69 family dipeptidase [[Lactobacillus] timonensis]